ncbi:hypothetical protein [Brevundimonas sp. SL161]|uniref:hypothetical protein n=1 Tax=Brevundimonas sp. SL161 TaxID=2804613 RepID=UPI003CF3CD53
MKAVLISAVIGMLVLFLGIFMMVFGNLSSKPIAVYAAFVAIPAGLALIGWSVVDRNRKL